MNNKNSFIRLQKTIFFFIAFLFAIFLFLPIFSIFVKSIDSNQGLSINFYLQLWAQSKLGLAFFNSVDISYLSAIITTLLAFFLAYTVNYTNISNLFKKMIRLLTVLPMLLPTITYGFAMIYSFGKQGLLTMFFGEQLFNIYGLNGLLIGYIIYTLPISFLLIDNTMGYIDKKFMIVSRAMGDSALKNFVVTIITPLLGTFAASFIQSFTLSFTDYGIPASVGGNLDLVANMLYDEMLGSLPNFNTGSVVAIIMLLPSVVSIVLMIYLEKYNIRYNKISNIELATNKLRDFCCGGFSILILFIMLSIFAVIFVVPCVEQWPYRLNFSFRHFIAILKDGNLVRVYLNSLFVALLSAIFGTLVVYVSALISARDGLSKRYSKFLDAVGIFCNIIPGMVLGVAYLLVFKGTPIQNTFLIIIVCNIIHFFSSPYLMMKNSLEKLNSSWETTARLMGDSWLKVVARIITPNVISTIVAVFGYYFINAMVTISAVIFIAGTKTMVITAKIKELQYFASFNEIFVLSISILFTNLLVKIILNILLNRRLKNN